MALRARQQLMSADELRKTLDTMASRILASNPAQSIVLLGIQRRGVPIAERLSKMMRALGARVDVGSLDINLYRDDLTMVAAHPIVRKTELPSDIAGRDVVLVDDVLYTGRTIRAAMEALNDYGRVKSVRLAVLVDRGDRELPIHADFVGRTVAAKPGEIVEIRVTEVDGEDGGWIMEQTAGA